MIIAIDFDGTIVEHKYPQIGKPLPYAFEVIRELKKQGHILILWTVRTGKELEEAVEFCRKNGVIFDAINENIADLQFPEESRKIYADVYIDDRNFGGFPGWGVIAQSLLK